MRPLTCRIHSELWHPSLSSEMGPSSLACLCFYDFIQRNTSLLLTVQVKQLWRISLVALMHVSILSLGLSDVSPNQSISYGLLIMCEVKVAGYWQVVFLYVVRVKVHRPANKNKANILPP